MFKRLGLATCLSLSLFALAPAADAQQITAALRVAFAPPALQQESPPPQPAPSYQYCPGYWSYNQPRQYYWVPGHWEQPPSPQDRWVAPRWTHSGAFWSFHAGYWDHPRRSQPSVNLPVVGNVPLPIVIQEHR